MRGFPWARLKLAEFPRLALLPSPALLVLAYMSQRMNGAGMVYITQKQIVKLSGLSQSSVKRAFKTLKDKQIIDQVDKRAYRINPRYIQIGKRQIKADVPGLIDVATGVIKKFKVNRSNDNDSRISLATET